jgi:hypothetical protein
MLLRHNGALGVDLCDRHAPEWAFNVFPMI